MRNIKDIGTGVVTLVLCIIAGVEVSLVDSNVSTDPLGAASFPKMAIILLAILACVLIWQGLRPSVSEAFWPSKAVRNKMLVFILWFIAYLLLVVSIGNFFAYSEAPLLRNNMGFLLGTCIYLVGALLITGRRKPLEIILTSTIVPFGIVISFGYFFKIMLP